MWIDTNGCEETFHQLKRVDGQVVCLHSDDEECQEAEVQHEGGRMSVHIFSNGDGAVFYCSTSQWAFGPLMPGANVAEAFLKYLPTDARRYKDSQLEGMWASFCQTRMTGPCGHYMKADVEAYGNETIFSCQGKRCGRRWNMAGEEIDDESEEEKRMALAEMFLPA